MIIPKGRDFSSLLDYFRFFFYIYLSFSLYDTNLKYLCLRIFLRPLLNYKFLEIKTYTVFFFHITAATRTVLVYAINVGKSVKYCQWIKTYHSNDTFCNSNIIINIATIWRFGVFQCMTVMKPCKMMSIVFSLYLLIFFLFHQNKISMKEKKVCFV